MSNSEPADVSRAAAQRIGAACLCLATQRAARRLARRFDEAFRPLGLTNGQFSLLMALGRPTHWRMAELAEVMAMDRTTVTAALKPLERRGLVVTAPDPKDRRARLAGLTDAGRALAAEAAPVWEREHAALEVELADADALRAGLRALG